MLRGKRPALCHVNVEKETEGKTGLKTRWCMLNCPFQKQIQNVVFFFFFLFRRGMTQPFGRRVLLSGHGGQVKRVFCA